MRTTPRQTLVSAGWRQRSGHCQHARLHVRRPHSLRPRAWCAAKMRAGRPLDDTDRAPWLAALGAAVSAQLEATPRVVLACSALKRAYRDALRRGISARGSAGGGPIVLFVSAPAACRALLP